MYNLHGFCPKDGIYRSYLSGRVCANELIVMWRNILRRPDWQANSSVMLLFSPTACLDQLTYEEFKEKMLCELYLQAPYRGPDIRVAWVIGNRLQQPIGALWHAILGEAPWLGIFSYEAEARHWMAEKPWQIPEYPECRYPAANSN